MNHSITLPAPAKINLALHVVGQRRDGYHLLDSIVAFSDTGDEIQVQKASDIPSNEHRPLNDHRLSIYGPFSTGLETGPDNLVLKAARLFGCNLPALDITLTKNLPVASGIGGGSADAAATLTAIVKLLDLPQPSPDQVLSLGADVPVCLSTNAVRMRGIGEEISHLPPLPKLFIMLVNPRVCVSTPSIFKALTHKNNPALSAYPKHGWSNACDFTDWLQQNRNDLESPAAEICPEIKTCLKAIATLKGVLLHRMSGSGATCFGLFESEAKAHDAAIKLKAQHPDWWIIDTPLR